MKRNINECRRGTKGNMHCVFKIMHKDKETRKLVNYGCVLKGREGHDDYTIYPEHNSLGNIIFQQDKGSSTPDCMRLGPNLIWENITGRGEHGLSFDLSPKPRHFDADIHPSYHREERNLPIGNYLSEEDTGEIMGSEHPALVTASWSEERFYGIDREIVCKEDILGRYDPRADRILPSCLKSHVRDIYKWINFTPRNENFIPKALFIEAMSEDEIRGFCLQFFKDDIIANRLADAMIEVKKGTYVNIWILMLNNFIPIEKRREFIAKVSLKSRSSLYKGTFNLQKYCTLYSFLDRMTFEREEYNINGELIPIKIETPAEMTNLYKENLLNYILNNPKVQKALSSISERYETSDRFWFLIPLLKRAKAEGILNSKVVLPSWLLEQIRQYRETDPEFKLFGKLYKYSTAPKDIKEEFLDSIILKIEHPDKMYPGMIDIEHELKPEKGFSWAIFCDILQAGHRWNMAEIRLAYDHFRRAYTQDDPSIFWDWIEMILELPYETDISISENEFLKVLEKHGKASAMPKKQEVLSFGASDFNLGEGKVSPGRAFALNLLNASVQLRTRRFCKYDHFYQEEQTWEVSKIPISGYYDATVHLKKFRECSHETFYTQLARMGGLKRDKEEIESLLSDSTLKESFVQDYEETAENMFEGVADMDSVNAPGIDLDDEHVDGIVNPENGEFRLLLGEGLWEPEE